MLGLIKKDLYLVKGNIKRILVMLVIFGLMSFQGSIDISFIVPFMCTMIFITTFSYDEYNKWDAYAITLPNGKKNVVKSKYFTSILLIIISVILTLCLSIVLGLLKSGINIDNLISSNLGVTFGLVLLNSIMFPMIFKYGVEKSRIVLFVIVALFTAMISIVIAFLKDILTDSLVNNIVIFFNNYGFIILPLIMIIFLYLSYILSVKIYNKKEF